MIFAGRSTRQATQGFDGRWVFADRGYDNLGRTVVQSEPYYQGDTTCGAQPCVNVINYDLLGRAVKATAANSGISTTRYQGYQTIATNALGQHKTDTHNALGELIEVKDHDGGTITYGYDAQGNLSSTRDINGNLTTLSYDKLGRKIAMNDPDKGHWRYVYNRFGELIEQTDAKGQTSSLTYDVRGRMVKRIDRRANGITSDLTNAGLYRLQNLQLAWDTLGNLTQRHETGLGAGNVDRNNLETFGYDTLNRLKRSQVQGGTAQTLNYDRLGNITYKSDVGHYTYGSNAGPHAVTRAGSATYTYDANGNNTQGDGRTLTYSTFDKVTKITKGAHTVDFKYGPDRARYYRKDTDTSNNRVTETLYLGSVEKVKNPNGTIEWKRNLGDLQITQTFNSAGTETKREEQYFLKDHLGSIDLILDAQGSVLQAMSFDAWGQRRAADTWGDITQAEVNTHLKNSLLGQSPVTNRGYTGHEMLDEVGIVHMNGRIYDAKLARFLQADPHIDGVETTQGFNRYSYVHNNPLNATDPSGYFVKEIAGLVVGAILTFATGGLVAGAFAASWYGAATIGAVAGAVGAAANGGDILQGALAGGVSGAAFSGAGSLFRGTGGLAHLTGGVEYFAKAAVHGVVGGITNVLQGGKFGNGFATAGVAKLFSLGALELDLDSTGQFLSATIAGGTASKITGGKFANGATTAALAYAVNQAISQASEAGSAQQTQRSQNGLGAALRGFGGGVASVFKGTGRAIRFIGRGTGLLGSQELADFNREGAIVDKAAEVLVTNEAVRNEVANQALNAAQNIELTSYNIGRATGRFVTGVVLSPLGLAAGIGDVTSTVETGIENGSRQLTDQIVESIILGN